MIKSLAHVAVMTTDAARAKDFYIQKLGFRETGTLEVPGAGLLTFLAIEGDRTEIELFANGTARESLWGSNAVGFTHICLASDDVRADTERLRAAGVEFVLQCHEVAGLRLSFLKDPDGNVIELLQKIS